MKKLLITLILMLVSFTASAQWTFTTENYEVEQYSSATQKFEYVGTANNYSSMFEINENQTIIKHTTATMTSNYYVKETKQDKLNDGTPIVIYDVVSDVGNKYSMVFSENAIFIYNFNDTPAYCIAHFVKRIFKQ